MPGNGKGVAWKVIHPGSIPKCGDAVAEYRMHFTTLVDEGKQLKIKLEEAYPRYRFNVLNGTVMAVERTPDQPAEIVDLT